MLDYHVVSCLQSEGMVTLGEVDVLWNEHPFDAICFGVDLVFMDVQKLLNLQLQIFVLKFADAYLPVQVEVGYSLLVHYIVYYPDQGVIVAQTRWEVFH